MNRIILRSLGIVISVVILLSLLAGCVNNTTSQTTKQTDATTTKKTDATTTKQTDTTTAASAKTINYLSVWPREQKEYGAATIMGLSDEYIMEHSNIKVEMEVVPVDGMLQKVKTLIASNDIPEAFNYESGTPLMELIDANLILDIEEAFTKLGIFNEIEPAAVAILKSGMPGMYCLPMGLNIEGIWYNKKLFADNNIIIPKTLDELYIVCDSLLAKGITPFSAAGKDKWPVTRFANIFSMRIIGYNALMDASQGKIHFTDPGFVQAITICQKMAEKGYFGKGFNTIDYGTATDMFLNGKTAMYYMGSWIIAPFNDAEKNKLLGPEGIGFFNVPTVSGGKGSLDDYVALCGTAFCLSKGGYDDQVADWAKYVFSHFGDYAMNLAGVISGYVVHNPPAQTPPYTKMVQDEMKNVKNTALWWEGRMDPKTTEVAQDNFQLLLTGDITPEAYLQLVEASNQQYLSK
jgi:raffinose/stachyose/melibiose transport system substrate-binding protein